MLFPENTYSHRQELSRLAGMTLSCAGWIQEAKYLMWILLMFFGTAVSKKQHKNWSKYVSFLVSAIKNSFEAKETDQFTEGFVH